ncbi:MAG: glycosyltransferase family 4 protein [Synechococcaceae cyanobacterium]|nr:glycosyltransferase family 4 protein [Synechococcaceae cyanobacterium]
MAQIPQPERSDLILTPSLAKAAGSASSPAGMHFGGHRDGETPGPALLSGGGRSRVAVLTTDAYGTRGGIGLFSRNLVRALSGSGLAERIELLARNLDPDLRHDPVTGCGTAPPGVRLRPQATRGKLAYVRHCLASLLPGRRPDLVICVHINLLPLAVLMGGCCQAPVVLIGHGIEVWRRPYPLAGLLLRAVAAVWCVSALSGERLCRWSALDPRRCRVLPNSIALEEYAEGPRDPALMQRHGLPQQARLLLTMARLDSSERYKGIDELLEAMPELIARHPQLHYLIVGDGDDRERLEARAQQLGLGERVRFAGYVPEEEKASHLRLADVFVMAGRGEGFGFVFLEALACGIPSVGSCLDGSREALRQGLLGEIADPRERDQLIAAIERALKRPRGRPEGLNFFDWPHFQSRLNALLIGSTV